MTKKHIIIIIATVVIIVFGIALYAFAPLFFGERRGGEVNAPFVNESLETEIGGFSGRPDDTALPLPTPEIVTREPSEQAVLFALSKTFSERYGTYSTDNPYENLESLQMIMTTDMAQRSRGFLERSLAEKEAGVFYGITSRLVNMKIVRLNDDETEAQIVAKVQQEETMGRALSRRIQYKDLMIDFQKIDGTWKVVNAQWQE